MDPWVLVMNGFPDSGRLWRRSLGSGDVVVVLGEQWIYCDFTKRDLINAECIDKKEKLVWWLCDHGTAILLRMHGFCRCI